LRLSATPSGKKPLSARHGNSTKILSRNTRTASRDARGGVPRLGHFTTRYSQCHSINMPPHPRRGGETFVPPKRSICPAAAAAALLHRPFRRFCETPAGRRLLCKRRWWR